MLLNLRENKPHGTREYPYTQYYIVSKRNPFQFPVHWHDEIEIIYIRSGALHVRIDGCSYTGHAGSIFLVNPRELHLMGSDDPSAAYFTLLFPLEFISFQTMDDLDAKLLTPLRNGHLQLTHAKRLLETTELQVIEVALRSGFSNVNYFVRMFKEKYGCTPLKYRQKVISSD